ncbi:hypothetical protein [Microbacterium helvum]|uniref:hypothetical protein n=1 Tax=Microbacterium helvum TaxID=2773713 RepID=UPI00296532CA|nr:hypothetical protein [Microbacterium helvum]
MRVVLNAVGKGRREHALPVTSTAYESGTATLVVAETEQRPTVLGLIASGRMRPDTGRVELDGEVDAAPSASRQRRRAAQSVWAGDAGRIRRRVALVDAPEVSEPEPNVTLAGVVAEELMFAGRASHPIAVQNWLADNGLAAAASLPVSNVDPADRVRALCELAVLRKGVEGFVLVSPDRHGGQPEAWWQIVQEFAARGFAVLVIAGQASARVATLPLVERAKRDETSQAALENEPTVGRGVSSRSFLARSTSGGRRRSGRPRIRRLTARTRGGRA